MSRPDFKIDHIGVAVDSVDEGSAFYQAMGWSQVKTEVVPTERVKVGFIPFSNGASVELLEPTSDDSVIKKYLEKRGPGIHHLCIRVQNLSGLLEDLKAKGVRLIDETPRPGAGGCQVAFVHPKAANGVLIELSEKTTEGGH